MGSLLTATHFALIPFSIFFLALELKCTIPKICLAKKPCHLLSRLIWLTHVQAIEASSHMVLIVHSVAALCILWMRHWGDTKYWAYFLIIDKILILSFLGPIQLTSWIKDLKNLGKDLHKRHGMSTNRNMCR